MPEIIIPISNYAKGRSGHAPLAFVIHIQQGTQQGTLSWFKNPASQVSAHVAIAKSGEVDTCVDERDTAYHAGRINAPVAPVLKKDLLGRIITPNLYTIGIECAGFRGDWFTEQQMVSVCEYIKAVAGRWGIPQTRRHIISHNEVTAD